jgi:uncharacterized protein YndB with AHSA1/START domain
MAKARVEGWLVLADISGYTKFLTGTELEHADAIIEDLVRGLLDGMRAPLRLVKLEGDAVFSYALARDVADGRAIVDQLEDAYHGFRMQLFNIARSSTCTCAACAEAPSLDLKFVVHFGEFLVHDLAGREDLQGPDVILVHRLLKNDVVEKTSMRAYLVASDVARARMGNLAWVQHTETYDHIGDVPCGVRDLHAAFESLKASGSADVAPEQADVTVSYELPVSPQLAFVWHMDEDKVVQWQAGMTRWHSSPNAEGRVGPGSTIHCAHGKATKHIRVVGWRPPLSVTMDSPAGGGFPANRLTVEFSPLEGGGTRVSWRMRLLRRTIPNAALGWLIGKVFPGAILKWVKRLREILPAQDGTADTSRLSRRGAAAAAVG